MRQLWCIMSILIALFVLTAVIAPVLWLMGEGFEWVVVRRISAVAMTLSWTATAAAGATLAALPGNMDFNTRWTGAVCRFVNAADARLGEGDIDRVRDEFARFQTGYLHETYESGWFLERLEDSTIRLQQDGN